MRCWRTSWIPSARAVIPGRSRNASEPGNPDVVARDSQMCNCTSEFDDSHRPGMTRSLWHQHRAADDHELAALCETVKAELSGGRVADEINHGPDRLAGLSRQLLQRIRRAAVDGEIGRAH